MGIILILLLLLVGLFLFFNARNHKNQGNSDQKKVEFKANTQQLTENQVLRGFPLTFPKEEGSTTLQNSESTSNTDGRIQSTKKFTSQLSAQKSLQKYADFFKNLGWKDGNGEKALESPALFTKDSDILMIVATPDQTDDTSVVEITIIQNNLKTAK